MSVQVNTDLADKIIALKLSGEPDQRIADNLGVKFNYVRFICKKFNVKAPPGTRSKNQTKCNPEHIKIAGELHNQGLTYQEVADRMGITKNQAQTLVQKSGVTFTDEQRANTHVRYKEDKTVLVLELRKNGLKLEEISERMGLTVDTVRYICAKNEVKLTKEQFSNNLRDYSDKQIQEIIRYRTENPELSREEIAVITETSLPFVKRVLYENELKLTSEQAQANAYNAKLESNPKAMEYMRGFLNEESFKKISSSLKITYKNQSLRELKGIQVKNWYNSLNETQKIDYLAYRQKCYNESSKVKKYHEWQSEFSKGENNNKSKLILKETGFNNFDDLMVAYAKNHNGKFLDKYVNSITKVKWRCSDGHEFLMRPNNIRSGQWCPKCSFGISGQEGAIYNFVKQFYPDVLSRQKGLLTNHKFELDIYIPCLKKAIEFDGIYHYEDLTQVERDERKNQDCKENGIELLRIGYEEYMEDVDSVETKILTFIDKKDLL